MILKNTKNILNLKIGGREEKIYWKKQTMSVQNVENIYLMILKIIYIKMKIKKFKCTKCKKKFPITSKKYFKTKLYCERCYNRKKMEQKTELNRIKREEKSEQKTNRR